jgi:hypothetical protein
MAQVITSQNHLESDMKKLKKAKLKGEISIVGLIFIGAFLGGTLTPVIGVISFLIVLIVAKNVQTKKKEIEILKSGLEGERHSLQIFQMLPDTYTVFSDLEIEAEGKKSQLDHVVVGENGIFIIETKNLNGTISGNSADHELLQSKVGRGGSAYSKTFYNPIKQVSTHVYRLSRYFKQNGIDTWIQGAVYFSNSNTQVMIQNTTETPVFSYANLPEMLQYITTYRGKAKLTPATQEKIRQLLG